MVLQDKSIYIYNGFYDPTLKSRGGKIRLAPRLERTGGMYLYCSRKVRMAMIEPLIQLKL